MNDNVPVFTSMRYSHTLPESATLGSYVLQVTANDSDSGANALIHYQLAPLLPGNADVEHFQVYSFFSGKITNEISERDKAHVIEKFQNPIRCLTYADLELHSSVGY